MNGKALPTVQSQLMHRNNYLQTMLIGDFFLVLTPMFSGAEPGKTFAQQYQRRAQRAAWGFPLEFPVGRI